ncbi:hypothetical protein [Sulfurimonas diazotrophicus]|uniref:SPOR domain-containing protein n=1 Tax=Sulfurimonas diazotrophicus TaxID=3131939 RepID=A0ABZ3H8X3_9BACT
MRLATLSFLLFLSAVSLAAATTEAIIAGAFQTEQDAAQRIEALQWYLQQDPDVGPLQQTGAFSYNVRNAAPGFLAVLYRFRSSAERKIVLDTIRKLHPKAYMSDGGEIIAGVFQSKVEAQQRNEALHWYLQHNPDTGSLQNEHAFAYAVSGGSQTFLAVLEQFRSSAEANTVLKSIRKLHPNAYIAKDPNALQPVITEPLEPQVMAAAKTPAKVTEAPKAEAAAPAPDTKPRVVEEPASDDAAPAEAAVTPPAAAAKHIPTTQSFHRTTPFEVTGDTEASDESMLSSVVTLLLAELLLGGAALMLFFRKRTH